MKSAFLAAGYNLPGEQLIGWKPEGALAKTQRGYLSNICTHKAVRRTVSLHLLELPPAAHF